MWHNDAERQELFVSDNQPTRKLPPHMQRLLGERSHNIDDDQSAGESRRAALERRRMAIQFDIDQGELALEPHNPWTHRIELLTEALGNVETEIQKARQVERQPYHPLPTTPISDMQVSDAEPYQVSFTIDGEMFQWGERLDWIERGGILAQPEFVLERGSVEALVPTDTPEELISPLRDHLRDSVTAFAVVLRDARLAGEDLPSGVTLADLAPQCPVCGGWMDYNKTCNACAIRKVNEQSLFSERQHLMKERSAEAEERHRLGERLPLALRRMADLERELAELET